MTLVDEPPVFDGAALQLRFVFDVDGELQTGAITVEALEDHFGARSALEADLRDAFEQGRARIEAACADVLGDSTGAATVTAAWCCTTAISVRRPAVRERFVPVSAILTRLTFPACPAPVCLLAVFLPHYTPLKTLHRARAGRAVPHRAARTRHG